MVHSGRGSILPVDPASRSIFSFLFKICVYACVCFREFIYTTPSTGACGGQRWCQTLWKWSCSMWVTGTEPRSFPGTENTLTPEPPLQGPSVPSFDRVSHCSPRWSGTCYVAQKQASRSWESPASASSVMGLQAWANTPGSQKQFLFCSVTE